MKHLFFLLAVCCFAASAFAQAPANDDCSSPRPLGTAPVCTNDVYTNASATASTISPNNKPSCLAAAPERDVWFTFVCPANILDFRIELTGVGSTPLKTPALVVYRGSCVANGLFELDCIVAPTGATSLFLDVESLTPGAVYYLRVADMGGVPGPGDFNLCVNEIPPIVTIDQGSSTLCEGTLYDSGGPDDDYDINEDFTFTICPNQASGCIDFVLEYFSLDAGTFAGSAGFDVLSFYDGPDVNAPVLAQINGFSTNTSTVGGGGVAFAVQAVSGCLTVAFQSDGDVNFEGFKGHWTCSKTPCTPKAPLEVETSLVAADIVNAVIAPGTTVEITNIDCTYGAYGTFSLATDNNDLGIKKGLVLSSGDATLISGPNSAANISTLLFEDGDDDLDIMSDVAAGGPSSNDACVVEMDVFVATDELTFEYIFGSEEYPEYVGQSFNDIFAFLVSGPGIVGDPGLANAKNIAVLPNSTTPVQINSVNNLTNWQYYRNNGIFDGSSLAYDGFTSDYLGIKKSLTARVDAIPCNTYHLKLAVADRGDFAFDSGVFISEVKGGAPNLDIEFASGVNYFIEECSGALDQLVISLSRSKTTATTYTVTLGGTATNGVDYLLNIPQLVTFQPGDTVLKFPILPISDTELEGTETITITITKDFGCGPVVFQTLSLELKDDADVLINGGVDTLFVCPGGTAQLEATGALTYFWEPPLAVSDPNIANPTITPTQDTWLKVTGTIGSCVDADSVFVKLINAPTLDVQSAGVPNICQGDTLQLLALTNTGGAGVQWTPKTRLSDPGSPSPLAYPLVTTTYTATIDVPGCAPVSDQITINVDTLFFPELTTTNATICQNYSIQLAETLNTSTTYKWNPAAGLSDPASSGPVATPNQSTVYTLTATSANSYCTQTATVTVNVTPADIDILGKDTIEICLGDTLTLTAQANPPGAVIKWEPVFYVEPDTGTVVRTMPDESITVRATYQINGCLVRDSVFIRVDSLPADSLYLDPEKPIYCPGDTVYLLSKTYEPANFPGMTHEWESWPAQITPVENWNMVILADTTHLYRRATTNHACTDTSDILVPVGIPPTFVVTVTPPEICPGQTAQIVVEVTPDQKVEWEDMTGTLSCTECKTPFATPSVTTTYMVSAPEADCPSGASATVTVLPLPALDLSDKTICLGDDVVLNNIPTNPADKYKWTANPPGSFIDPDSIPAPTVKPTVSTVYTVTATGKCNNGGTVTVDVHSATIDAGPTQTVCPGTEVTLTANVTSTSPGTVVWSPSGLTGTSVKVSPTDTTTYTARYIFQPDCQATDFVTVNVWPGLSLGPIQTDSTEEVICEGVLLKLKVAATPPDVDFTWLENGTAIPGATLDSVAVSPVGSDAEEPVRVEYTVVATDENGCTAVSGPFVQLVKRCIVFPNAFTPGNDDANETFSGIQTFGGTLEIVEFRIFNRWGQKVFESSDDKKTWDGRVDGKDAPMDVYAYYITVRFGNGDEHTYKGEVSLLR